jgi:hypothetical protein
MRAERRSELKRTVFGGPKPSALFYSREARKMTNSAPAPVQFAKEKLSLGGLDGRFGRRRPSVFFICRTACHPTPEPLQSTLPFGPLSVSAVRSRFRCRVLFRLACHLCLSLSLGFHSCSFPVIGGFVGYCACMLLLDCSYFLCHAAPDALLVASYSLHRRRANTTWIRGGATESSPRPLCF